ncbi:MAG: mannitol dehydrogenase family protein, partial [Pseudomonadota bacterium]
MPRIVHLGFGNFHRAHQAWYTQRANAITGSDWRITGVSMTRPDLRDALAADGFSYTLAERGAEGLKTSRITVHDRVLVAAEDPRAVVAEIADPQTQIVTLTVTEKGYCLGPDGRLDLNAPAIVEDLRTGAPRTAIGLLAHGLAARAAIGAPLTVLSCDNLPENGEKTAEAVARFAEAVDTRIAPYLSEKTRFPSSMVDRITPATTNAIRAEISALTRKTEPSPVLTEAFSDWVITDDFATPHP